MDCPKCGSVFTRSKGRKAFKDPVLGPGIRRKLRCDSCSHTFTTVELLQEVVDVIAVDQHGGLLDLKRRLLEGVALITRMETRKAVAASAASDI